MKNRHEVLVSFRMRELKMKEMIKDFLDELSSSSPTPGGGGASGLVGAIGCALGLMVGNLTVGKKKYKDVEDEIREIMEKLEDLKKKLVTSVDDDAENFKPLAEAYRLPKNTEEEKKHKEFVMESCLLDASLVPLQIMDLSYQSLKLFSTLNEKGSVMAISDVGVGVQCLRSALTGSIMNVYINTKSMKNREMAEKMNKRAEKLLVEGQLLADGITNSVIKKLGGTSC